MAQPASLDGLPKPLLLNVCSFLPCLFTVQGIAHLRPLFNDTMLDLFATVASRASAAAALEVAAEAEVAAACTAARAASPEFAVAAGVIEALVSGQQWVLAHIEMHDAEVAISGGAIEALEEQRKGHQCHARKLMRDAESIESAIQARRNPPPPRRKGAPRLAPGGPRVPQYGAAAPAVLPSMERKMPLSPVPPAQGRARLRGFSCGVVH
jgi:hypothetical protein